MKITKEGNTLKTAGPINALVEYPNSKRKLYTIMHGDLILYPYFKFPYMTARQAIKVLYELPVDWDSVSAESLKAMPTKTRQHIADQVRAVLDPLTQKGVRP